MKKDKKMQQSTNKMNKNNRVENNSQNQSVCSKSQKNNSIKNSNTSIGFDDNEDTKSFDLDLDENNSHSFELE